MYFGQFVGKILKYSNKFKYMITIFNNIYYYIINAVILSLNHNSRLINPTFTAYK